MEQNNNHQEEMQEKDNRFNLKEWSRNDRMKIGLILICGILAVLGAARLIPPSVSVNNSVDGRELPIYCVETDQKVVG